MIIQEFSFGNYRSFKDIQTLNLSTAKIKSKNAIIDTTNVIKQDEIGSFLKSKAIYGANASGKSNIVKALVVFVRIIRTSVKYENVLALIDPFRLSTTTEKQPCFFQMIFWINGIKYRYGFEADSETIVAEWLFAKPKERETPYFIRDKQVLLEIDKTNFTEGHKLLSLFEESTEENDIFRKNSLFLTSLASLGFGKISKRVVENLGYIAIISGLGQDAMFNYASESLSNEIKKRHTLDMLKYGDIGIDNMVTLEENQEPQSHTPKEEENIDVDKNDKHKMLVSFRKKFNDKDKFEEYEAFSMRSSESEGTLKLFELSPFIYDAINEKKPLIIDEFDARFHPLLTKKIVELFNSDQNIGSQLIFTTHDTNLLSADLLRRDQIEFVEKDKYGASHLYSLVEFKGVRNTASFEKDYIQGKYGAIPFLVDFSRAFTTEEDAKVN